MNAGDRFGESVAISKTWLVVGAPKAFSGSGAVYIFTPELAAGTCPIREAGVLTAPDPWSNPEFGRSVAVSKKGDLLVVGAREAAYVYRYDGKSASWVPDAPTTTNKLQPDDPATLPDFGRSVSIDADWAIVGAPLELEPPLLAERVGAVYFFRRIVLEDPFAIVCAGLDKELNPIPGHLDEFGAAVSLFAGHAAVGAPFEERALGSYTQDGSGWVGRVYQYDVDPTGILVEVCTFLPLNLEDDAQFGAAVSIDDRNGAIGAPRHDRVHIIGATCDPGCSTVCLEDTGATFVFEVIEG